MGCIGLRQEAYAGSWGLRETEVSKNTLVCGTIPCYSYSERQIILSFTIQYNIALTGQRRDAAWEVI